MKKKLFKYSFPLSFIILTLVSYSIQFLSNFLSPYLLFNFYQNRRKLKKKKQYHLSTAYNFQKNLSSNRPTCSTTFPSHSYFEIFYFYSHIPLPEPTISPIVLPIRTVETRNTRARRGEGDERGSEGRGTRKRWNRTGGAARHSNWIGRRPCGQSQKRRTAVQPRGTRSPIFYADHFQEAMHTRHTARGNWFPSNNYSLPGKQALSRDVGLATKLLPSLYPSALLRVAATARRPPLSTLRLGSPSFPPLLSFSY